MENSNLLLQGLHGSCYLIRYQISSECMRMLTALVEGVREKIASPSRHHPKFQQTEQDFFGVVVRRLFVGVSISFGREPKCLVGP